MAEKLAGKVVAILATDGVEQIELMEPRNALREAGAEVHVVAPKGPEIQGFNHHDKGDKIHVDTTLDEAQAPGFDALVLPGGVINPDDLRLKPQAIDFIRHFVETGKPISAICHGPWTLIEAGGARGKTMTSWPSLQTDLTNAGAAWIDQEVVTDGPLVTSRKPDDLEAFIAKTIETIAAGKRRSAAE
jgi:protease I